MLKAFEALYPHDGGPIVLNKTPISATELPKFLREYGGHSFGNGLYRVLQSTAQEVWQKRISEPFPEFFERATFFAYDWLGRVFALDSFRLENMAPGVLMFEPGTGEVLEIPCNLRSFHETELVEFGDAALATDFFHSWLTNGGPAPTYDQCIGYKKPLFLGGEDEISNLEVIDLDVYWHFSGQMIKRARRLPPGTPLNIR